VIRRRVRVGISKSDETASPQESSSETDLQLDSEIPIGRTTKIRSGEIQFQCKKMANNDIEYCKNKKP
jgi:hypothetical protein